MDTFRDSCVGQIIRLISGGRFLKYHDEIYPQDYQKTVITGLTRTNTLSAWTTTRNPDLQRLASGATGDRPTVDRRTTSRRSVPTSRRSEDTHVASDGEVDITKIETQATEGDARIVTWLENDPANPQNWSFFKKCWATTLVCFLTFSIYIGSAIYTAGTEGIAERFHVSPVVAVLGLTLFVLGYGLGPMFLAGFAEAPQIGRSPVYIFSVLVFTLLNLPILYAKNIGTILAFRFLTGFFGSPVLATGGASLADIWHPFKQMYAIGIWGMFAVMGPVMGPLVGGFAAQFKSWRWPILELIWLNAFCTVLLAFALPETSSATILYKRAKRLRKGLNDPTLQTEAEIEAKNMSKADLFKMALVLPFTLTFLEPILVATDLYLGLVYAVLYCWFEAFPLTFQGVYHMSAGVSGLAFLGLLIGAIVTVALYFVYLRARIEPAMKDGSFTPEMRMPIAIVGSIFLPICMFWFGWTAKESIHWISPIIASSFFSVGALLLFNAILNYQGDAYPKYVGAVFAGNDLFRSGMGAAFPLFATNMYTTLGLDWGNSLLGFLSIAFIPIPILLWKYGRRIRMASKNARHDI